MEEKATRLELAALRQAIQQEENTELDRTITYFLSLKNNKNDIKQRLDADADRKHQDHHNTALFSLFCLKAVAAFQLVSRGDFSCREELRSDMEKLFSLAQRIAYEWDLTDEIVSDVLDFLTALYPSCEDLLPDFTGHYLSLARRNARPTTSSMRRLFRDSIQYYLQTGRNLPAYQLLEALCRCSKIRDTEAQYQQLVLNVLSFLTDSAPEVECRICHLAEPLFAQEQTERAGSFYWLYGCCLEKEGQWSDAQICFEKCCAIRQHLYGETNWFTAVARRESAMIAYSYTDPGSTEPYHLLLEFVHGLQAQNYTDLPRDQDLVHQIEGKTLYLLLSGPQFAYIADLQRYAALLRRYTQICQQYHACGIPLLNLRLTWNLWGNYYVQTGDLIQAEACFQRALTFHVRSGASEILTDAQVKSNLLMTYYIQNDIQHALPLLNELLEQEDLLSNKDSLRVFLIYIGLHLQTYSEMTSDQVADLKDNLQTICHDLASHDTPPDSTAELVTLLVVSIIYFIQTDLISQDELDSYWSVLQTLEPSLPHLGLTSYQCIYFYYCETLMASLLFPQQAEAPLQKTLYYLQRCNATASTTGAVYQLAASLHAAQPSLCLHDADIVLHTITEEWRASVRYANDSRLSQSLALAQLLFNGCYSALRCCLPDHALYEKVLSFKSLASLAGRERNKVIRAGTVDTHLVSRIGDLQNQIAALHAQALFRDTEQESAALDAELRRLEADFALQFPYKPPFVSITLPHVIDTIPNHSLVLEYFATARHPSQGDASNPLEIDLFVLSKENGQTSLERLVLSEGSSILQMADSFTRILQAMAAGTSTIAQEAERECLRLALYRALLQPVVPKIAPRQTLYIAPDNTLTNLPFELLYADAPPLADQHHMVKLECARDFLFHTRASCGHGGLVIGCPAYTVDPGGDFNESADSEVRRSLLTDLAALPPLPFADLEAQEVAASLHTLPKTGIFASKQLVLDAAGYSVIHIATHGFFDLKEESNALYSSCLFFAGTADWARTGQSSARFGNGILTADEISRLDLRSVELVVLSSCLNGMNDLYTGREFEGMVGAFAAAGVGYIVASLWNVAESAGIVLLMELFYNFYLQEHLPPPVALNKAKHTLRQMTVGQLRQQGWFHAIRRRELSGPVQQRIDQLERCPDRQRPFKNELFWGGFICYQCNHF